MPTLEDLKVPLGCLYDTTLRCGILGNVPHLASLVMQLLEVVIQYFARSLLFPPLIGLNLEPYIGKANHIQAELLSYGCFPGALAQEGNHPTCFL